MKYDLAIFDMDGTILNTLEDLADSLNASLSYFSYPERTIEEVRQFVGNGIRLLIERGVPQGLPKEKIDQVHEYFMVYYKEHCADKTRPYDGVISLICQLRQAGCKTAIVSNKADTAVKELAEKYFSGLFDISIGERTNIARKPAPDAVNEVLEKLSVPRERAVYIGDSEVDIATAQNAELDSIIVDWGFRRPDFLREHGAKIIVSSPEEVKEKILEKRGVGKQ